MVSGGRAAAATAVLVVALLAGPVTGAGSRTSAVTRVARVVDGDTIVLTSGARVRLVQIDTPEVWPEVECYGPRASAVTERLLPPGTLVGLAAEPATDAVDAYGRLLRYVVRVRDGVDVNVRLVRLGAAAPYFYDGRRGRYAALLDRLARRARAERVGLWGACPHTRYDPYRAVATRRSRRLRTIPHVH